MALSVVVTAVESPVVLFAEALMFQGVNVGVMDPKSCSEFVERVGGVRVGSYEGRK
jgi:hypothetical protein